MALGAQNKQQMAPAQFVGQYRPEGLLPPGNYSRLDFDASVPLEGYVRMAQDAMQKQAAFEAAYQERQNNMGWDLVDRVQSTLDKGVQTSNRFENMKAQALANQLTEQFGVQEKRAALDLVQAQIAKEIALGDKAKTDAKYAEPMAKATLGKEEATKDKAVTDAKYAGPRAEAEISQSLSGTNLNNINAEINLGRFIQEREAEILRLEAVREANRENKKIYDLYLKARNGGDLNAFKQLENYALPDFVAQYAPEAFNQSFIELEKARASLAGSDLINLAEKSKYGFNRLAAKLQTEGPRGVQMGLYIAEIVRENPNILSSEQVRRIIDAFEYYKKNINPNTKLNLPQILDNFDMQDSASRDEALRRAQDKVTAERLGKTMSASERNSLVRGATSILQQDPLIVPGEEREVASDFMVNSMLQSGLIDPRTERQYRIQKGIRLLQPAPGTKTDKPNVKTQVEENNRTYLPGQ